MQVNTIRGQYAFMKLILPSDLTDTDWTPRKTSGVMWFEVIWCAGE